MTPLPAHSPFGGSVAARVLACPASVGLTAKAPANLRKPSIYADRGSALHVAMTRLIEREIHPTDIAGVTIGDYLVTPGDVEDALRPALAYADALLDQPDAEYFLEKRVAFPSVESAFGTADLLVRIGATAHVIDFKFGQGVLVRALTPDGDEDVLNGQLMFYAAAARHSAPEFFAPVEQIALTIVQPQAAELDAEIMSSVTVTHAEVDAFIAAFRGACEAALAPSPPLKRGVHCRFCVARPICHAHTGPLIDLAQFVVPAPGPDYYALLARGLDLCDAVGDISKALRDQAERALEAGESVPGYALTAGRATRRWKDESDAVDALIRLGLARADLFDEPALRSPKQIEIRAKARGLKISPELILSSPSGVSLCRAENARLPLPGRQEIARGFAEALTAFAAER